MEAIPLNGIKRPGTIFNAMDTTFEKDALFYPSKAIDSNGLTEVELVNLHTFELVNHKGDKILYDSIESNGFLFSESVDDFINEDEYAIISDCDENGSVHEENVTNCDAFVTIHLENGHLLKEMNSYESCDEKETKTLDNGNQVSEYVSKVNGHHRNQTSKASIVNEDLNFTHINEKVSRKNSENKNKKISVDNVNEETVIVNGEKGDDDEKDLLFSFENTSTPNKDYEMKILAGRNDVSELTLSTNEIEPEEDKSMGSKEPRKNRFKLGNLSTRIKKPSLQTNSHDTLISIPLEDLRNLNSEIIGKHDYNNKMSLFPTKPFSISVTDLKTIGPIPVIPRNRNGPRVNTIYMKKGTGHLFNNTDTKYGDKSTMKRSVSETIPPRNFDLEMAPLDDHPGGRRLRNQRKSRYTHKKQIKDDSFFEIDNRYGEFDNHFHYEPIELELKTIVSTSVPNDILSATTDFTSPRTSIEILRKCEVTSRYISFFKQPKYDCKYISVAFFNVNQPNEHEDLDVPYEEVLEQVYTHVIEEVIIYEDEYITCNAIECSICDDEWFIIK